MKNTRKEEIINSIKAFDRDVYQKSEVLPELFNLQNEIIKATFSDEDLTGLKLYDVENYFTKLNDSLNHPADKELAAFKQSSQIICNKIKAEISGNKGEQKAFRALENIHGKYLILKNVELQSEDERSELDAVVFTPKGIFIVEVKNTGRDIFIDDEGNYYRTGEFLRFDSNIFAKMETKESLLRTVIGSNDSSVLVIKKIVVFTNNRVQVQNRCKTLTTCFLSQLPYLITENSNPDRYNDEQMYYFFTKVKAANHTEAYPVNELQIDKFKKNYAELVLKIKDTEHDNSKEVKSEEKSYSNRKPIRVFETLHSLLRSREIRTLGKSFASLAVTAAMTYMRIKHS